ncbi:MAG: hypothetical protein ACKO37_06315 [Vampirovibrionales bacterium]
MAKVKEKILQWLHTLKRIVLLRFKPFHKWFAHPSPWRVLYPLVCLVWWSFLLLLCVWLACSLFCGGLFAMMLLQDAYNALKQALLPYLVLPKLCLHPMQSC